MKKNAEWNLLFIVGFILLLGSVCGLAIKSIDITSKSLPVRDEKGTTIGYAYLSETKEKEAYTPYIVFALSCVQVWTLWKLRKSTKVNSE